MDLGASFPQLRRVRHLLGERVLERELDPRIDGLLVEELGLHESAEGVAELVDSELRYRAEQRLGELAADHRRRLE